MFDKLHEECGVFAIYGNLEASKHTYLGLYALQHRGQESAGIAASDGSEIRCHKAVGHIQDIFPERALEQLKGHLAIGHTRYSTAGDTTQLNAQPFSVVCNKGHLAVAHNGNITNAVELRAELEEAGSIFQATSDTEVILHMVARSRERKLEDALRQAMQDLEGAFSLVFMAPGKIIVARDRHGFRPLAMGQMDDQSYVFASETCAFDLIGATYIRDVNPGEMIVVGPDGMNSEQFCPPGDQAHCVFEHVYFARPDSLVFGRPVQQSRHKMGELLSKVLPVDADYIVPVPDSGTAAAVGYSAASGIPYRQALIRNHYIGRTFIEPKQSIRDFGVKLKLNPVRHLIEGKSIVLVDDSIVRGTTSKKIVRMVRAAGAREVHMRISCPPTISPCFYGVDTPTEKELIASTKSIEEIRRFVEADTLAYLPLGSLREAVADNDVQYCYACYTGNYPTELVNIDVLRKERMGRRA